MQSGPPSLVSAPFPSAGPRLGLQAWTCRNMSFDQVVGFAVRHGIRPVQFVAPLHLDPAAPPEENLRKKAQLERHGLAAYTIGVVNPTTDRRANRRYFEFARLMGMKLLVVEPFEPGAWDNLEELVREFDLRLAIHNHGRGTVYGDPASVAKILAGRDRRIGVCLDVGWVTAAGFDAAKVFRDYGDRVYDIHFKDKRIETAGDGKPVPVDTEIGAGEVNCPGLFKALAETNWSGVMAIETDSDVFAQDPDRLVTGARRYFATKTAAGLSLGRDPN